MLLIVTPAHNEAVNLPGLARSLAEQDWHPEMLWVIVDDGSSDDTRAIADNISAPCELVSVSRRSTGGLADGGAFAAWRFGVEVGLEHLRVPPHRIMKLDADVLLPPHYFALMYKRLNESGPGVALIGGVVGSAGSREQNLHVPGALKCYSTAAYQMLSVLPSAVGFDVMDEVVLKNHGLPVVVMTGVSVEVVRTTGSSAGWLAGRRRNGLMMRWTGYDLLYALLHTARYMFRRPRLVGSMWMMWGYLRAGRGPYPDVYRVAHRREQRMKLLSASRHPIRWTKSTYGAG